MAYGLDRDDFDAVLAFLDLLAPKSTGTGGAPSPPRCSGTAAEPLARTAWLTRSGPPQAELPGCAALARCSPAIR